MNKRISILGTFSMIILLLVAINLLINHKPKIESVGTNLESKINAGIMEKYNSISSIKSQYFSGELQILITLNENIQDDEYYQIFKSIKTNIINNHYIINASHLRIKINQSNITILTFQYNSFDKNKVDKLIKWELEKQNYVNNNYIEENQEYIAE